MKKYNFIKGKTGEETARIYLQEKGYSLVESNYSNDMGEIDIIMTDRDWLVFVEVKYKKDDVSGRPEEMINSHKISRIVRVSMIYLLERKEIAKKFYKYRIDAVCILDNKIFHYKNIYD